MPVYAGDTIESLQFRVPLPVGDDFGSIFWSQSFLSVKPPIGGWPDHQKVPWIVHYAIPKYGGFKLDIKLNEPLRKDEGFENVSVDVDYLMGTIEREYTRDWNHQSRLEDLSVPAALIRRLEKLLLEWHGQRLMVHYCLFPGEGDPLSILLEFSHCETLPDSPDEMLLHIALELTEALAS